MAKSDIKTPTSPWKVATMLVTGSFATVGLLTILVYLYQPEASGLCLSHVKRAQYVDFGRTDQPFGYGSDRCTD